MKFENVHLSKECGKIVEFRYSIMQAAFENALKHVKFFHLEVQISRDNIWDTIA